MSQYGAQQMAKEGKSYKEILSFYYPGTKLTDLGIPSDRGGDPRPDPEPETKPDPKPETKPDPKPEDQSKQQFGRVNVSSSLNVRQGAGTGYKKIGSLYKGDRVEILDRSGAWYKIKRAACRDMSKETTLAGRYHNHLRTYLMTGSKPANRSAPLFSDDRRYGIVTASSLNVRGSQHKNHIVGMVVKGTKAYDMVPGSWYRISLNGKMAMYMAIM